MRAGKLEVKIGQVWRLRQGDKCDLGEHGHGSNFSSSNRSYDLRCSGRLRAGRGIDDMMDFFTFVVSLVVGFVIGFGCGCLSSKLNSRRFDRRVREDCGSCGCCVRQAS